MSNTLNISMNNLSTAFVQQAKLETLDNAVNSLTENGDFNFGAMGEGTPSAALMELDQMMVRPKVMGSYKPKKTKAGHFIPNPEQFVLPAHFVPMLDEQFNTFKGRINSLSPVEQANMWGLMFRYTCYLRNLRGEGKRERLLFYYLLQKVHEVFPKTSSALVSLVPDYGYFGDLDVIINTFGPGAMRNSALAFYRDNLNADALQVFGKPLVSVTFEEAKALNDKLKAMSVDELNEFVKGKKLSLAAKHLPREGKKDANIRQILIDFTFSAADRKNTNFMKLRFRNIISALTQCLRVGETMMCAAESATRNWDDIDFKSAPAGFLAQHRSALLNEKKGSVLSQEDVDTGNRSTRPDRIQCRKNVLQTILEGKLKGLQLDLSKLAKEIAQHIIRNGCHSSYGDDEVGMDSYMINPSLSSAERAMLSQQYKDMVDKIDQTIETMVKENTSAIDPRNVVPMVDRSGSMQSANVDVEAVVLGLVATRLSKLKGCMITFSRKPRVLHIDLEKDIFNQFLQVYNAGGGYNTDIDAAYNKLLELMVTNKVESADFALMILTDGQFDSQLVNFGNTTPVNSKTKEVFYQRMEEAFKAKGYNLPRTIFWNLNGGSPGFPAQENTKGIQMVSGYSQTLMLSVFTGDYKLTVDEQGNTRVDVDPWQTFLKSVTSDRFSPVLEVCRKTKEGVFAYLS